MSEEIDALLSRVDDPVLRTDLRRQIDRSRAKRTFGLVFENHVPETVRLPSHPVRRGALVARRDGASDEQWIVTRVNAGTATLAAGDGEALNLPVADLVVLAEFGTPIYPGLRNVGSVSECRDKPAHVVINGENHHALEALQFTHAGAVDCVYIDPPYNTGARDWKYNNDYVDAEDGYRHSKWLAFMQRRLRLAKNLLNPDDSVLIVTIDEKEYLRLGMLLHQEFPGATIQMVSSVINPKGTSRSSEFSRTDEYVFFVMIGEAAPASEPEEGGVEGRPVEWGTLRRRDLSSVRHTRPAQFYPIFVETESTKIARVGSPLPPNKDRESIPDLAGC